MYEIFHKIKFKSIASWYPFQFFFRICCRN